jgi:hypothetical protein
VSPTDAEGFRLGSNDVVNYATEGGVRGQSHASEVLHVVRVLEHVYGLPAIDGHEHCPRLAAQQIVEILAQETVLQLIVFDGVNSCAGHARTE